MLRENVGRFVSKWNEQTPSQCLQPIEVLELDWSSNGFGREILSKMLGKTPDIIVCSDCVYQSEAVLPLLEILKQVTLCATLAYLI